VPDDDLDPGVPCFVERWVQDSARDPETFRARVDWLRDLWVRAQAQGPISEDVTRSLVRVTARLVVEDIARYRVQDAARALDLVA
jgi:glycine cleavage system aminomethyltransferase T